MQYFAMNFNDSGIAMIGLNNTTGKLEEEAILFVPMAEITDVKFNQKLLAYELETIHVIFIPVKRRKNMCLPS